MTLRGTTAVAAMAWLALGCAGDPSSDLQAIGATGDTTAAEVDAQATAEDDETTDGLWWFVDEEPWEGHWNADVTCHQLPDGEICDGWDNDCDGLIDEDDDSCHCGKLGAPCGEGFECAGGICINPAGDEIYVPGGSAVLGCDNGTFCGHTATPKHAVHFPPFIIDRYPVTVARYRACVSAGNCAAAATSGPDKSFCWIWPFTSSPDKEWQSHPINGLTWFQARNFCVQEGKRLCTSAEWEKAGRGGCRVWCAIGDRDCCFEATPTYPWGNDLLPWCEPSEFNSGVPTSECACETDIPFTLDPVGAFAASASAYGVETMVLTVHQWVEDCGRWAYSKDTPRDGSAWIPPGGCGRELGIRGDPIHGSYAAMQGIDPMAQDVSTAARCCRSAQEAP